MTEFTVSFFYKGETITLSQLVQNEPNDIFEASGVSWGAIRTWFSANKKTLPYFVRNVKYSGSSDYNWDLLPLNGSTPSK